MEAPRAMVIEIPGNVVRPIKTIGGNANAYSTRNQHTIYVSQLLEGVLRMEMLYDLVHVNYLNPAIRVQKEKLFL